MRKDYIRAAPDGEEEKSSGGGKRARGGRNASTIGEEPVQSVRRVEHLPAQSDEVPVQRWRRGEHLPAQSDTEQVQDVQGRQGRLHAAGSPASLTSLMLAYSRLRWPSIGTQGSSGAQLTSSNRNVFLTNAFVSIVDSNTNSRRHERLVSTTQSSVLVDLIGLQPNTNPSGSTRCSAGAARGTNLPRVMLRTTTAFRGTQ